MFNAHWYVDGVRKRDFGRMFLDIPQAGDTVRLSERHFGKVTEIIWCMDEPMTDGQRVNIRIESLKESTNDN